MHTIFSCLFVVVAISTLSLAQTDEDKRKAAIAALKLKCVEDSKVDTVLIERARKLDFSDEDQPLKKYIHCIFLHVGFQDNDGNMQVEVVANSAQKDKIDAARKLANKCKETKATKEDTAYDAWKCFISQAGDIHIDI